MWAIDLTFSPSVFHPCRSTRSGDGIGGCAGRFVRSLPPPATSAGSPRSTPGRHRMLHGQWLSGALHQLYRGSASSMHGVKAGEARSCPPPASRESHRCAPEPGNLTNPCMSLHRPGVCSGGGGGVQLCSAGRLLIERWRARGSGVERSGPRGSMVERWRHRGSRLNALH